ncbi:MAG TPA: NAD(P)H-dependent glycerol-3-phosphate dehydrogenase [Candidatus Onthovivens sp.]|nr:NAD(P)H-dependent glycerol-3-phosphate dehydrogenase [Candidatus Onthovivens sp.]
MKVSLIGAGEWGVALAEVLAYNGHKVLIWSKDEDDIKSINKYHTSKHYEGYKLSKGIKASSSLEEIFNYSKDIVISLPVPYIIETLKEYFIKYNNKNILLTSKGLFKEKRISALITEINPNLKIAILSGPSFAKEVIKKYQTAVVIASNKLALAKHFQKLFTNIYYRAYTSKDVIGLEYLGALKNVYAIASGLIEGRGLGYNTKCAMITRAITELERVVVYYGGKKDTLLGLGGMGDLILTCSSPLSRNFSYGKSYFSERLDESKYTIEGIKTLKEVYTLSVDNSLHTPIINALYEVLFLNQDFDLVLNKLMSRKLS